MSKNKKKLESSAKIYSRLRMIANGSNEVNAIRSISNKCIATSNVVLEAEAFKNITNQMSYQYAVSDGIEELHPLIKSPKKKVSKKVLKKKSLKQDPPNLVLANVFIELRTGSSWKDVLSEVYPKDKKTVINKRIKNVRVCANLIKATVIIDDIKNLAKSNHIISIEGSQAVLTPPLTSFALSTEKKPLGLQLKNKKIKNNAKDIIIGIIDVGGFDFAHSDFLDKNNNTRFISIWDQNGMHRSPPNVKFKGTDFQDLDYGSVIDQKQMNEAIKASSQIGAPVHAIEPQSQKFPSSHAIHVASIAAGNTGVCSHAYIAGVLISLPPEDEHRSKTFTDSSRISDAVDYLLNLAKLKDLPISINISLGTNGHAHDGSSAVNRWIDTQLTEEGRCLCVATGNAGQEKGLTTEDFGYVMGRIHTSGKITNKGLNTILDWHVVGNGISDLSENELEIWYEPQDRFSVKVKPPGLDWIGPIKPQQFIENQQLEDLSFISIYNKIYHPANGDNQIAIYISPNLNIQEIVGVRAGLWKVKLIGEEIRDGSFDAWIERDDPVRRAQTFWNFPSFFSERTNVDNKSINSLACGHNVIAVGNYDVENDKINITSSQGPSRDNRKKPEIVAPGTNIIAASGFTGADALWASKTGTSMASPYACGVAGLLLAQHPQLTSVQIAGIMKRTSLPITGFNYDWKNDTGFGIINVEECLEEAIKLMNHEDITAE
ncbi:MAG: S8 family serine peptidase [Flavobacteriaceae bacterium]|nr:S8 family serine peptidase [Flavobacteriaceae bacterium]